MNRVLVLVLVLMLRLGPRPAESVGLAAASFVAISTAPAARVRGDARPASSRAQVGGEGVKGGDEASKRLYSTIFLDYLHGNMSSIRLGRRRGETRRVLLW